MKPLELLRVWWSERRWSQARKAASRWKRKALDALRDLHKANKHMEELLVRLDRVYVASTDRLAEIHQEYTSFIREIEAKVKSVQETIDQYDHAEEMLNNELEIYREVVVPQLALAAEVGRQQLQAEIDLQVQRQVLYKATEKNMKE